MIVVIGVVWAVTVIAVAALMVVTRLAMLVGAVLVWAVQMMGHVWRMR
jgi:hypothetical protein